ncbi:7-cyano-7-deazaguanine synthase QueC [Candidatus Margulisiibacteriota bacterium]
MPGSSRKKSIVLLSSGLDSTVSLASAVKKTKVILALTFDYGQKAAKQETAAAKKIAKHFKIKHKVVKLDWLADITKTALVKKGARVPMYKGKSTAQAVWVPNRNLAFISIAASFAEALKADLIITGFNKEEAKTFPDNSKAFVDLVNRSLKLSTLKHPKVVSYTQFLDKKKIVKLGMKLGAPLQFVYSCYEGGPKMCDRCESCIRFKSAF